MKRFTETAKWQDEWFQDLPTKYKVFWQYICDQCDCCGVWKVNLKLAAFQIGEELDGPDLLQTFAGRIEDIGNGRWFIPQFCAFQYGTLSPNSKPHQRIIQTAAKHGIAERLGVST